MTTARDKGQHVEHEASVFLHKQGLQLITRNYQCRTGEIDLIMLHQQTLVFVEVRFRHSNRFGSAVETVNYAKQRRIILTAEHFLQQHKRSYVAYRFDVVGASLSGKVYDFEWIQNAFQL